MLRTSFPLIRSMHAMRSSATGATADDVVAPDVGDGAMRGRNVWFLGCAAAAVVLGVGCSGERPASSDSGSGPVSAAKSTPAFPALDYRLMVPAGWQKTAAREPWTLGGNVPGHTDPSVDAYQAPGGDVWFVVGKRQVSAEDSLADWIERMISSHTITFSQYCTNQVADQRRVSLGGDPAVLRAFKCQEFGSIFAVQVLAKHHNDGWFVMCVSEGTVSRTLPNFERQCQQWLSTFEFV